jgi:hypothetical protein
LKKTTSENWDNFQVVLLHSFIFCTKVKAFNSYSLLVKIFLHKIVLRPTVTSTFSIFLHTQSATMKRFSYNTTGLSPVLKKPHPTMKDQEKTKEGAKQEQPWIVQGAKKTKTKNNNKQQL